AEQADIVVRHPHPDMTDIRGRSHRCQCFLFQDQQLACVIDEVGSRRRQRNRPCGAIEKAMTKPFLQARYRSRYGGLCPADPPASLGKTSRIDDCEENSDRIYIEMRHEIVSE